VTGPRRIVAGIAVLRADNPSPMTLEGTNSYLVDAAGGTVVVDPGPGDERHLAALAAYGPIRAIVLTHGHPDHSEGAPELARRTGAPVLARDPAYGDPLPAAGGWVADVLQVIDAPGHTADSVCFRAAPAGPLLTGDTVLGRGTTVVAHPDGRLADYLATLATLLRLVEGGGLSALLPGHGPVLDDPAGVLTSYATHRRRRLAEVQAALDAGDRTPADVVRRVYADVDPALWPAAELSVRAQLDYLADPG